MSSLLTAEEVAELLRVPLRTVYEWARRGQIPHLRCGRLLRFDEDQIRRAFGVPVADRREKAVMTAPERRGL